MQKPATPTPRKPQRSAGLTEKSVGEIRSLHARTDAGWTQKSLARIFGTTETAIGAVLNRTGAYKKR
jgi:transcriptional regulator